jgi:hypothetical protein
MLARINGLPLPAGGLMISTGQNMYMVFTTGFLSLPP